MPKIYIPTYLFMEYLSNRIRMERTIITKAASDWVPVTSGILQGSMLGPIFYYFYK